VDRRGQTVLIAEDDADARTALAGLLRDSGYTVVEAANGADALTEAHRLPGLALIVLDMMMPIMDGWQFLAERVRDPQLRNTPTIVLSDLPPSHPDCYNLPVTVYCAKPFRFDYLAELVDSILVAN